MRINDVSIKNFRALEKVEFRAEKLSVLAGPNAIGKTSVLEAIRLAKTFLAPENPQETQQTLQALGMVLPGVEALLLDPIAGDIQQPVSIRVDFVLTGSEIARLRSGTQQLALSRTLSSLGASNLDPSAFARFLSTQQGQKRFSENEAAVRADTQALSELTPLQLQLEIGRDGIARGSRPIAHEALSFLSREVPSYMYGLLSYFPADRAMPPGEANVQLGVNDATAQRASHLGAPASKYARLKNLIVSQTLLGTAAAEQLRSDFALIFSELLDDKEFADIQITPEGRLAARVKDRRSGRTFDIDQLSSGEKGLLLTVLLMRLTVAPGGVILLDEPELHLNAAVCRKLLPFLASHVCHERDVQVLLCTHSPEILAHAYTSDDCALFHLRRPDETTPIRRGDRDEVNEALRRLGAQPIEMLYSRGFLFVEGDDDVDLCTEGFGEFIRDLKLSCLGGRGEVEKQIRRLQAEERQGKLDVPQFFLFDRDNVPTGLTSSPLVRLSQWQRYCLESYLLEPEAIYDAAKQNGGAPESIAWIANRLEELGKRNLMYQSIRRACEGLPPSGMTLAPSRLSTIDDIAAVTQDLGGQYEAIRSRVQELDRGDWEARFREEYDRSAKEESMSWDKHGPVRCDGKRVLRDLYRELSLRCSALTFKRAIVHQLGRRPTVGWEEARQTVAGLVAFERA